MKVTYQLADSAGFCWGVKRAIKGAEGKHHKVGEPLYVLGELVHNRKAVEDLENQGVHVVRSIEQARDEVLLITAHGRDPQDIALARTIAKDVLDMTCPIVQDQHKAALSLQEAGRKMILIGTRTREHPEVLGTIGVLRDDVNVVESVQEVHALHYFRDDAIGVIAQTTFDQEKVALILGAIRERYPDTRYVSTICDDIAQKQDELRARADDFDTVIVIGDHNSANATHLAEIARDELGKSTLFILDESELDVAQLEGSTHIFVTAGASTPHVSIEGVVRKLEKISCE